MNQNNILYERIVREHDNRKYKRKPAKGKLIFSLEKIIQETHLLINFDGYIIPTDGSKVTLLLYCREYNNEQVNNMDDVAIAKILYNELLKEVRFDIALKLSEKFNCSLACVFSPFDYPEDEQEAMKRNLILFPHIEKRKTLVKINTKHFQKFLKDHQKRFTKKSLTFACTKLEYFLSQIPQGETKTIAFPGDADGILLDDNYNIIAILEYKSDTYGKAIESENITKYKEDTTRFNVLDDFCKLIKVPLVIIFWSDTHNKSKITIRNSRNKKEVSIVIQADTYQELASLIKEEIFNLQKYYKDLSSE